MQPVINVPKFHGGPSKLRVAVKAREYCTANKQPLYTTASAFCGWRITLPVAASGFTSRRPTLTLTASPEAVTIRFRDCESLSELGWDLSWSLAWEMASSRALRQASERSLRNVSGSQLREGVSGEVSHRWRSGTHIIEARHTAPYPSRK